ncbi:SEL1-like repeat protein [Glaesserella parasuis]|uniref:tetratricopeptide repeat protein n=1 Tax=Glaesserella parasuis TaxID=738 RepID=UPI00094F74E2|nr:SEL1-like repeat protein [Glaesserella parasuis]MCT8573609.1 SEL1-like repeat protein [Glaesserella parasuis]MCT8836653.1 SEL1-like repeat protein [Glaesserella parasuis]MDG6310048.1 SEL1-like repeat protein [Glaesserella parasuis]MDG6410466.1 SEL1-like repeat protein [Glaesserella parasuis]MDG6471911.1 SEL1-like repeat protein [Glaesserella parasuis]
MSFITQLGKVLFGSNIKPNTGDQHTDKVSHQVYEQGVILLSQGNYEEALNHFKKAASFGHISAKYNLALMLFNGLGDYPDFELARKFFQEAKNAGHTRCDEFLSFMQEVDEIFSEYVMFMFLAFNPSFIKNGEIAIAKFGARPEMQAGNIIYLVSRYFISRLKNNINLVKIFLAYYEEFLDEDEFDLDDLEECGLYQPNLDVSHLTGMINGDLTDSIDNTIWNTVKKNFDLDDYELEDAKFRIVREVIKQIHHL